MRYVFFVKSKNVMNSTGYLHSCTKALTGYIPKCIALARSRQQPCLVEAQSAST
jgi:hypothetical protein